MIDLARFLETVSAGLAGGSLVFAVRSHRHAARLRKRLVSEDAAKRLGEVLHSSDIKVLGKYLVEDLGSLDVAQYSRDESIRKSVDSYLHRIAEFLGSSPQDDTPMKPTVEPVSPEREKSTEESKIEASLASGETWNALARFRRVAEVALTRRAEQHLTGVKRGQPISQLIRMLTARGLLNAGQSESLGWAISVANRGIHGLEVSTDEAREAIAVGLAVLRGLDSEPQGSSSGEPHC